MLSIRIWSGPDDILTRQIVLPGFPQRARTNWGPAPASRENKCGRGAQTARSNAWEEALRSSPGDDAAPTL